jgi:hypothetical protein
MAVLVVALVLGSAAIALVGFVLYLAFCAFVVIRTGGTSGLRDVAVAIRAFASVGSLSSRGGQVSVPPPQEAKLDQITAPEAGLTAPALIIPPPAPPPTSTSPPSTMADR